MTIPLLLFCLAFHNLQGSPRWGSRSIMWYFLLKYSCPWEFPFFWYRRPIDRPSPQYFLFFAIRIFYWSSDPQPRVLFKFKHLNPAHLCLWTKFSPQGTIVDWLPPCQWWTYISLSSIWRVFFFIRSKHIWKSREGNKLESSIVQVLIKFFDFISRNFNTCF